MFSFLRVAMAVVTLHSSRIPKTADTKVEMSGKVSHVVRLAKDYVPQHIPIWSTSSLISNQL